MSDITYNPETEEASLDGSVEGRVSPVLWAEMTHVRDIETGLAAEAGGIALAARALHRWRHPTTKLGTYRFCRCEQDAAMAMEMFLDEMRSDELR